LFLDPKKARKRRGMGNVFSGFNALEYFFLICAVIGGFFVLLRLIMLMAGGHTDIDSGIDIDAGHADSDVGFHFLSLHGLSSFFVMFGLVGLALYRQSRAGAAASVVGAVAAGLVTVWVIFRIFQWAMSLQSSGNISIEDAVGSTGIVYLNIPPGGIGRVTVNLSNHLREFDAMEKDGLELATGNPVHVVKVNANVLIVELIK
jgi:membrane protein implicated in regulation of membrane protease activity